MKKIRASMALAALSPDDARQVYINDVQARRVDYASLLSLGWEEAVATRGSKLSDDGREVIWSGGRALALRPEVRQQIVAEAAEREQNKAKPVAKAEKPGESLTSVLCPVCRSAMAKVPVCPNCAKGKAGFKTLCVCTDCGHEVYL